MRFFPPLLLVALAAGAFACVHDERRSVAPVSANELAPPPSRPAPPQYIIADPGANHAPTQLLQLRGDTFGLIVDKRRIVVSRGEPRVAADVPADALAGAAKVPARMGGGFVFWTQNGVFRADAFDGKLLPVASMPAPIESLALGPGYVLVRTQNGERWGIGLPKGDRVVLAPLGVVDVAATEDGRVLAYDDRRGVHSSLDGGMHWADVTAQLRGGFPTRVFVSDDDEIWLVDSNDNAMRLERDGRLAWFDKAPTDATIDFRPTDPRWHGTDAPLRVAVRAGIALDDHTALVLEGGDLVKVDTRTGELVSVYGGHLPPDASCEGLSGAGEILFACSSKSGNPQAATSYVVSHVLSGEPIIEQTFAAGGEFYASDDGGLAYGGGCVNSAPNGINTAAVCVRTPSGQWEERDLSSLGADSGAAPPEAVRWIPRADGRVVALLAEPTPGLYDPATGVLQELSDDAKGVVGAGPNYNRAYARYGILARRAGDGATLVDGSWSYVGNTLHGIGVRGNAVEISEDGKLKVSPYEIDGSFAGPMGLGKSKDGRVYQTSDRGLTWTEVAAPPSGADGAVEIAGCSTVGCDLGAFYRMGWQARPPVPQAAPEPSAPVPSLARVRGVEIACHPSGPVTSKLATRTESSPDDLGLGAVHLPITEERTNWQYLRMAAPRGIVTAWGVGSPSPDPGDTEQSQAMRSVVSGYSAAKDDSDVLVGNGPVKSISVLRRSLAFIAPFDPAARIVRTGFSFAEIIAAGRRAGLSNDEMLDGDPTEDLTPFPIASADPSGLGDIGLFSPQHGLLAVTRGERVRLAFRGASNQNGGPPVTFAGAALPGDEVALIEYDSSNVEHVYKLGAGGMTDVFDMEPPNEGYHGANPDAVAVGPKGELAILRIPSGSDPPSAMDPAYLVQPGQASVPLAPWSTAKLAEDAACKAEPGGYRAVVQSIGPWIRVTTPDLHVADVPAVARVRWTERRVCIEGLEVKLPAVTLKPGGVQAYPLTVASWLVARGGTYARVATSEGVEWRQPLECAAP